MQPLVQKFDVGEEPVIITYDSGADGNYVSEEDQARLGVPILQESNRRVDVSNGGSSKVNLLQGCHSHNYQIRRQNQTRLMNSKRH